MRSIRTCSKVRRTMRMRFTCWAYLSIRLGITKEPLSFLARAGSLNPHNSQIPNNLGMAYRALDRLDDAIACYRRALAIDADGLETEYNLANALRAADDLLTAVAHYEHVLAQSPDHGGARKNNLALTLKALGRLQDARGQLLKLIEFEPINSNSFCNLGVILMELGYGHL